MPDSQDNQPASPDQIALMELKEEQAMAAKKWLAETKLHEAKRGK